MKKTVLIMSLAFVSASVFAQDLTSKKGEPILPESGDWAISFDAAPFLNYAGRMLSTAGSTSPSANYVSGLPFSIVGKMFKDEKTAYRAMIRIGNWSTKSDFYTDDVTNTDPAVKVTDTEKDAGHAVVLGAGMEMRRGKTRLQGYYGGMAWLGLSGTKQSYEYGNAISTTNTSHTNSFGQGAGVTENKPGSSFSFGVRGFIGAEYFILSKISVGAEYGWGIGFSKAGEGEVSVEAFDITSSAAKTTTTTTGGSSTFSIDTDINATPTGLSGPAGQLMITLHF